MKKEMNTEMNRDMTDIDCCISLDVSLAAGLQRQLQVALDNGMPVRLQAHRVERTDTAILQLLASFMQAARRQGIAVSWERPSAALCRAARLLGLVRALELPT